MEYKGLAVSSSYSYSDSTVYNGTATLIRIIFNGLIYVSIGLAVIIIIVAIKKIIDYKRKTTISKNQLEKDEELIEDADKKIVKDSFYKFLGATLLIICAIYLSIILSYAQ